MKPLFALVAIAAVACQQQTAQKAAAKPAAGNHLVAVQDDELVESFRTDPGAAQVRYGGKLVSVTGSVGSVWRSGNDTVATLREPGSHDAVAVALDEDFDGSAMKVRQGQTITAACTQLNAYEKPMMLRKCKLASTSG